MHQLEKVNYERPNLVLFKLSNRLRAWRATHLTSVTLCFNVAFLFHVFGVPLWCQHNFKIQQYQLYMYTSTTSFTIRDLSYRLRGDFNWDLPSLPLVLSNIVFCVGTYYVYLYLPLCKFARGGCT